MFVDLSSGTSGTENWVIIRSFEFTWTHSRRRRHLHAQFYSQCHPLVLFCSAVLFSICGLWLLRCWWLYPHPQLLNSFQKYKLIPFHSTWNFETLFFLHSVQSVSTVCCFVPILYDVTILSYYGKRIFIYELLQLKVLLSLVSIHAFTL